MTRLFLNVANMGAEWVLWLLVLLSFVSVAIIVERYLFFYKRYVDVEELQTRLQELLGTNDLRGAWELVGDREAIECAVVAAGLRSAPAGAQSCSESMLSTKAKERKHLETRLAILGTIGSNAPFVGLLGTVLGIIKAAHDLALQSTGTADPNAVMAGVFEALVATAVGLFVAIPAVVAFNFFQRKVKVTIGNVDSLAHLVLASLAGTRRAAPTPPAVRSPA